MLKSVPCLSQGGSSPSRRSAGPGCAFVLVLLILGLLDGVATRANAQTPKAFFLSASQTWDEGSGTRNVSVWLNMSPATDLTLSYTVGGTATAGSDYAALSGTVTVPKGVSQVYIPVAVVDDSVLEVDETVVLTLIGGTDYKVGGLVKHRLTITDNEPPPKACFVPTWQNVNEGSGTHHVKVRLDKAPTSDITVKYTAGGTAAAGSDFTIANSGTVTVAKGATTATIPVTIVDDSVYEETESVLLNLADGEGYRAGCTFGSTLNIFDDDPPTMSFVLESSSVHERHATVKVKVKLDEPSYYGFRLSFKVGGTATPWEGPKTQGADFMEKWARTKYAGTVRVPDLSI